MQQHVSNEEVEILFTDEEEAWRDRGMVLEMDAKKKTFDRTCEQRVSLKENGN